jgi:hypothetical protein
MGYRWIFLLIACMLLPAFLAGEDGEQSDSRMEITLERYTDGDWKAVDGGLVLSKGDRVRFRFETNFDGYLYVTNLGTSGKYELLFPREETGLKNKLEAGREYIVPATTNARFRVDGPAGQDITCSMAGPTEMDTRKMMPGLPGGGTRVPPHRMQPRCDDSLFRARGECIDSSAGLRGVDADHKLPEGWENVNRMKARELFFMKRSEKQIVATNKELKGPVVYEFRVAHK